MKVIINQNEKGLLFRNGKFVRLLDAGKYSTLGGREIETWSVAEAVSSERCTLDALLADAGIRSQTTAVTVADEQLALHFVDGKFRECLVAGRYAFWNAAGAHSFTLVDISTPEVSSDIPDYIFAQIPDNLYHKVEVSEYQKARLFINNRFVRLLDAGTYYFWRTQNHISVDWVDTRLTRLEVSGQEILTQDKVTLRVNFVCSYRVTDCVKVLTEVDDYIEQLHIAIQLALREYVGRYRIDEILDSKEQLTAFVLERLKAKEKALYVEVSDAGVKDIILPGEIRDIMNTVLVAEKRAQANVITRREEVASTRSLLNTAKLMEENQTLYKLKELEYLERICEHIGSISVNGSGDILSQLASMIKGK